MSATGGDLRHVALVELQRVGDRLQVEAVLVQVVLEVADRLDVGLHPFGLAVGDEDHAVDALEDELAAGVVEDLPGDGVEVEAGREAADRTEIERQEVEEERAVGFGGERDHLALRLGRSLAVDELQVGRLSTQPGAVVDDLAVDLAAGVVDERHGVSRLGPGGVPGLLGEQGVDVLVRDLGERTRSGVGLAAPLSFFVCMSSKM